MYRCRTVCGGEQTCIGVGQYVVVNRHVGQYVVVNRHV